MIRTHRTRGEVDIITVFGTVVPGSSPGGCTDLKTKAAFAAFVVNNRKF